MNVDEVRRTRSVPEMSAHISRGSATGNAAIGGGHMWVWYVAGAVASWGVYGAALHKGQVSLGNPLRSLLCVGVAYFLIGVLVPTVTLVAQGEMRNFNLFGTATATAAGALGALGAVCIIFSFRAGASPLYVMPLVFGGAPLVNVLTSMVLDPPKSPAHPLLYVGFVIAAIGAAMVLYFRPH
jgi:hypothetical protein